MAIFNTKYDKAMDQLQCGLHEIRPYMGAVAAVGVLAGAYRTFKVAQRDAAMAQLSKEIETLKALKAQL